MNKDIEKITNTITNFVSTMKETLKQISNSKEKSQKKERDIFKQDVIGPLTNLLSRLLQSTECILSKGSSKKTSQLLNRLEIERANLGPFLADMGVDLTQSLVKFNSVKFPENEYNTVHVGEYFDREDGVEGFGCVTNGKYLYNGSFAQNQMHGFGMKIFENGNIFTGDWCYGKPKHGKWKFKGEGEFYGLYSQVSRDLEYHCENPDFGLDDKRASMIMSSSTYDDPNGILHECIVGISSEDVKPETDEQKEDSHDPYDEYGGLRGDRVSSVDSKFEIKKKIVCSTYLYYKSETTDTFRRTDLNNIVVDQLIEIPYLVQPLFFKQTEIEWLNGVK